MSDAIFYLQEKPALPQAEKLEERLEKQQGVIDVNVDASQSRIFVTFDPDRTGELALQQTIEQEGFHVSEENAGLGFTTDQPGYTELASERELEQEAATQLTQDAELKPGGKM